MKRSIRRVVWLCVCIIGGLENWAWVQYYADEHYRAPTAAELHASAECHARWTAYLALEVIPIEAAARREDKWEARR